MARKRSILISLLLENKGIKLAALVLAVVTWYAIQGAINFEFVMTDVPLQIAVDKGWAVLDRSTDTVDIELRGSQEDILRLNKDYVEVLLDVRGKALEGSTTFTLTPQMVRVPGGIRVVDIRPMQISLSLDREARKAIPVKVDLQGEPPNGYEVDQVTCTPAAVEIKGPKKRLRDVERIRTRPVTLDNRTHSFRERVELLQPSERWVAQLDPEKVLVEIEVLEFTAGRTFERVEVKALLLPGPGYELNVNPSRVRLTLEGREEDLQRLMPEDLTAYVDCSLLERAARYELPVQVDVPSDVVLKEVTPSTVGVAVDMQ
jgi:YbbR domain-containing protein